MMYPVECSNRLYGVYKIPTVVVYSDASSFVCGALSAQVDQGVFHRMWTSVEANRSSTWRELKAIELYLITYKGQLTGKVVKCFTDSKNCESIVLKGSTEDDLQDLACSIFSICALNSISLLVQWLPRDQNTAADAVSKFFDYDDLGVSYEFFAYVDFLFGPHTIDRFADSNNTNLLVSILGLLPQGQLVWMHFRSTGVVITTG